MNDQVGSGHGRISRRHSQLSAKVKTGGRSTSTGCLLGKAEAEEARQKKQQHDYLMLLKRLTRQSISQPHPLVASRGASECVSIIRLVGFLTEHSLIRICDNVTRYEVILGTFSSDRAKLKKPSHANTTLHVLDSIDPN